MRLDTAFLACLVTPCVWGQLSEPAARGKEIYRRGMSPSGQPIMAVTGNDSSSALSASVLTCVNCHGYGGRGKAEGGVTPSDITWQTLTTPYGVTDSGGRTRPPYNESLLKRAITLGIDSAGNALDEAMPRFQMTQSDAADLIAYVQQLGNVAEVGVSEDSVRIGVLLPPRGQMVELSGAVESPLRAYFDGINAAGGINGRLIDLRFSPIPEDPAKLDQTLRAFFRKEQLFALVASYMAGVEDRVSSILSKESMPQIGPITLLPSLAQPPNPYTFYLDAGLIGEAEELAKFAQEESGEHPPKSALLVSDGELSAAAAERIRESYRQAGYPPPLAIKPEQLLTERPEVIFVLIPGLQLAAVWKSLSPSNYRPLLLVPGTFMSREVFELPPHLAGRVFVAFATSPGDYRADAVAEYRTLRKKAGGPSRENVFEFRALAAAKVLVESLRRAGRDLSRDALIESLEKLYEFETGLSPPISYAPTRRVGATGAQTERVDLKTKGLERIEPFRRTRR